MTRILHTPEEIAAVFTEKFGDAIGEVTITEWAEGVKKTPNRAVWIRMSRDVFHDAVQCLVDLDYPHLGVISGADIGDEIELLYHMWIYFGERGREIKVTLAVSLQKSDLSIPTIADIIPGAVYSEREKQEMLGIRVVGIPDSRGLFLPPDFPEGVYPWRKDETGIREDMVKDLWAVGRPTDRPAPPVAPKEEKKKDEEPAPAGDTPEQAPPAEPETGEVKNDE
ncbi:MAG TPA: NADH-quinone oxidoreductase subunit C [Methanoculleus sp.]|nr:NADH-quinone oxidoreductase subunit C [Methanoculleus sp.]